MNWEYIIIGILFILALLYIVSKFYNPFSKSDEVGCSKGCGCGASSIKEMQKKMGENH
ncbi:FeoB-associated Cys-rich membrane protein [Flavobacteriaceae bacterium Ap0902]|nr:FeoB-associated Cys-rich membrane protein [Flavobacteriaceae bacterium Ap0902]